MPCLNLPPLPPGLWRVMLSTALVVLAFSLLSPVLAVRLQTAGVSGTAIGTFAMLSFLSVALLIPVVPHVFARIGVGQAYRLGLALELIACLGYLLTDNYTLWCALGVLGGVGAAAAWNATEALIAHNVPASHRGRLTGLYQAILGAGMAIGPFLPGLLGLGPLQANAVAATGLALGLSLTLTPTVGQLKAMHADREPMSMLAAWRFRPVLVWAAIVGGVFEVGLGTITTAYGSQIGLNLAAATSIAGALGMGSFTLQYPLGWLADHVASRRLFAIGAVVLAISGVAFTFASQWPALIWVCAALWGAVGGALYTLSMIRVAHDFADSSALAGTSAMIAGYTIGGSVGPLVSGWVFDHVGVLGQGCWLTVLALSLLWLQRQPTLGSNA
ncbi:MAG: MFS transporter [Aquabacterium sp.]|uniref:MFS transporter n=1 Tax=Aquabacterium sp. TaxID=1872578 RepID=UPI001B6B1A9A|nr:MFS transporter [Aquabacterium sp.]MBP7132021.1 MFS transporter [Aquabacterium sp.]